MCEMRHLSGLPGLDKSRPATVGAALRVLAVGDLAPSVLPVGANAEVILARFDDIGAARLVLWRPALVLAPLVGIGFDCFDLAERLTGAGFTRRLRAVVDTLPNPAVVRREFAAQFPGLDFDVLVLGDQD